MSGTKLGLDRPRAGQKLKPGHARHALIGDDDRDLSRCRIARPSVP